MSETRCLVGVRMIVFEPGYEATEEYLQYLEDSMVDWKFPAGCKCIDDCIIEARQEQYWEIQTEEFRFDQLSGKTEKRMVLQSRTIYRFSKWAVGFECNHIGTSWISWSSMAQSLLEWASDGSDLLKGWLDELIELADPLIHLIAEDHRIYGRRGCLNYSVQFPTVWTVESHCYDGDCDFDWWLDGRLDLTTMKLIETEPTKPIVVCLCGSTRFSDAFQQANLSETLAGRIVLTIGCDMRSDGEIFADKNPQELAEIKAGLDQLHLQKIDMADEVLILNVDGYVGESTRRELRYARQTGKRVRWLEPEKAL